MRKRKKIFSSLIVVSLVLILGVTVSLNVLAASNCLVSVAGEGNYVAPRATAKTKATVTGNSSGLSASNSYCDAFVYLYWYDSNNSQHYYSDYATKSSTGTFYSPSVAKWKGSNAEDFYSFHKGYIVYKGIIEQTDTDYIYDYD